jgi:hypothetical protein
MPLCQQKLLVLLDDTLKVGYLATSKTVGPGKNHWLEPKLGNPFTLFYVDVRRFRTLEAEKEKAIAFQPQDRRH